MRKWIKENIREVQLKSLSEKDNTTTNEDLDTGQVNNEITEEKLDVEKGALSQEKGPTRILKQISPWLVTVGIFYYIFSTIPINEVMAAIQKADMALFIPAAVAFTLIWYLMDIGSWYLIWNWFNCKISVGEVVKLRGGVLLFQAVVAPLAGAAIVFYLNFKKKVPILEGISSGFFFGINDYYTFMLFFTPSVFLMDAGPLKPYFVAWAAAAWFYAILHFIYWMAKHDMWIMGWFRELWINRPFRMAGYDRYYKLMPWRAVIVIVNVICHYFALKAFNIQIPLFELAMGIPIIFGTSFLPISVGGMGVPQLLWMQFYGDYASKADITAFSLVWATTFLITRVLIGAVFVRFIWSDLFPKKNGTEVGGTA